MTHHKALARVRMLFLGAAMLMAVLIGQARAAETVAWDQAAFTAAQEAGKPIVVEVNAPWCPICAKQRPAISALEKDPKFAEVIVFSVDFDTQKDVVRQFHVSMQSTLIAFKGKMETTRSTGVSDPAEIRGLFERTL